MKRYRLIAVPFSITVISILGNRTGAVLNDSPVDCQSRDLDRPQAAIPLAFTRRKGIAQICGTFFCYCFVFPFWKATFASEDYNFDTTGIRIAVLFLSQFYKIII